MAIPDLPEVDRSEVERFHAATESATNMNLSVLHELAREGRWQAPPPDLATFDCEYLTPLRLAVSAATESGDLQIAFDAATRIRDSRGSVIHDLVGTTLRARARRAGFVSPDVPSEESFRSTAFYAVHMWAIPFTCVADLNEVLPQTDLGWTQSVSLAIRIVFGGRANAFSRVDTVQRLRDIPELIDRSHKSDVLARLARGLAAPFPYGAYAFPPNPIPALKWALSARRRNDVDNPVGKLSVAAEVQALSTLASFHESEWLHAGRTLSVITRV